VQATQFFCHPECRGKDFSLCRMLPTSEAVFIGAHTTTAAAAARASERATSISPFPVFASALVLGGVCDKLSLTTNFPTAQLARQRQVGPVRLAY